MTKAPLLQDARGASRLVVDLTVLVARLVETMHHNIARRPGILGPATFEPTSGITGLLYRSVRGITRGVGAGVDAVLAALAKRIGRASRWRGRDPVVAALNGVVGDYLADTGNPLAIPMQFRVAGHAVEPAPGELAAAIPNASSRVVVMVHGLCMSDLQWHREGRDHGQALARDLHADSLYLFYNSGRAIHDNGAELATLLERLVTAWPVRVTNLVLVGHSLGGLVIRSACAAAEGGTFAWAKVLRAIAFLGTPHLGAPLERAGHGVHLVLAASPYTAALTALASLRSAGITDLRHGTIRATNAPRRAGASADARATQPLPRRVRCLAIAGSTSRAAPRKGRAARGDGLVPVDSALGCHADPLRALDFGDANRYVAYGTGHLDLLSSAVVYDRLRRWLLDACASRGAPAGANVPPRPRPPAARPRRAPRAAARDRRS